ncbi:hypothetical protein LXT21_33500 [Myxococcus sp. K38C18041901]|uniref:hypothetical protein n=1 Tax=Myxococcus guangdongensis TaxID=2906760 RepID=UPI0020A770E9|nr:hypothetical protein [Myxococcus guangdongensis]MCP3063701.1 hypothetical protein [Myxococcus guangdongensis]
MALPSYRYARVALDAELHVQVSVDHVELPPSIPGEAVVSGRIARVFRGSPSLCSTPVSFKVPVCDERDHGMPPSGILWTHPARLTKAPVIEVFLDAHDGGFRNASYDNRLLPALTDTPTRVYTEEMARAPVQHRTAGRYDPRQERREFLLYGALSILALGALCWALVRWSS